MHRNYSLTLICLTSTISLSAHSPPLALSLQSVVFSASPDSTIRVWSVTGGNCVQVVRAHEASVTGLSLHATGDYLLSSSEDQVTYTHTQNMYTHKYKKHTWIWMSRMLCEDFLIYCLPLFLYFLSRPFSLSISTGPSLTSKQVVFSPRSLMRLQDVVSASLSRSLLFLLRRPENVSSLVQGRTAHRAGAYILFLWCEAA